ncbi:uncharacterized protein SCHCODRAFT_01144647 [Schizophyllum commune H4-8]|uniref:uncharacterized protein n=1 Tax=Schizophyllum commune (strain H4-8 / FGSC 9210) TaxID=578458 RepID=UPI00216000E1|nr:uncharacterized protein SCHCODRAFT_01144647 [Schizophyllum commune H4-8]KAI5900481.1 hypothetical protein SCHCODRAFT_01144647 [Schizophyllum commune H4-8]
MTRSPRRLHLQKQLPHPPSLRLPQKPLASARVLPPHPPHLLHPLRTLHPTLLIRQTPIPTPTPKSPKSQPRRRRSSRPRPLRRPCRPLHPHPLSPLPLHPPRPRQLHPHLLLLPPTAHPPRITRTRSRRASARRTRPSSGSTPPRFRGWWRIIGLSRGAPA